MFFYEISIQKVQYKIQNKIDKWMQNNYVFRGVDAGTDSQIKTNTIYKLTLVVNWINVYHAVVLNCRDFTSFFFLCALQVYEEKEKMWERELRKIKGLYDNRLRASQQKSSKMEQALTNQTYQVTIKNKSIWFFFLLY